MNLTGISLESGLGALSDSAAGLPPSDAAERLRSRLAAVHSLIGQDLVRVESLLHERAQDGPAPGDAAAAHLVCQGGKRVRPMALLLSAACFGEVPDRARELAAVAELIHSATLLHDDVVDEGTERRGVPASRVLHGNAVSVLSGDLLLVHALDLTQRAAPEVLPDLIATLRALVSGEIIQLRGRRTLDTSAESYELILRGKTASLFAWATSSGARIAGASAEQQEKLRVFGEGVGIAFQLVDDTLDYTSEDTGKTLFADLREGKLTLPLVLAAERRPELLQDLRSIHAGDLDPIERVRRAVLDSGACELARARARETTENAISALRSVPETPARQLLEGVARQLTTRTA